MDNDGKDYFRKLDQYTKRHSLNVARNAGMMAEHLGLSNDQKQYLIDASTWHDIGKLFTPSEILNKNGKLTDIEFEKIKEHTTDGYDLVTRVSNLVRYADAIRHHHEKMDGSGYPDGLKGHQIEYLTKIISIIDIYEALTSERPYKDAWPHEKVKTTLLQEAMDNKLDKELVEAFINCIEKERSKGNRPDLVEYKSQRENISKLEERLEKYETLAPDNKQKTPGIDLKREREIDR